MNRHLLLLAAICTFAFSAFADDTNVLKTDLGVFEARTGVVIIKGFEPMGVVNGDSGAVSVACKESTDVASGKKLYGIAIGIEVASVSRERTFVDYDEIEALLQAINYLNHIDYDATSMPSFEASFATKGGLRIIARSVRREGTVQTYVQYGDLPRVQLPSIQMKQFYELVERSKKNLDALRDAK
jgi:hypothetical protein